MIEYYESIFFASSDKSPLTNHFSEFIGKSIQTKPVNFRKSSGTNLKILIIFVFLHSYYQKKDGFSYFFRHLFPCKTLQSKVLKVIFHISIQSFFQFFVLGQLQLPVKIQDSSRSITGSLQYIRILINISDPELQLSALTDSKQISRSPKLQILPCYKNPSFDLFKISSLLEVSSSSFPCIKIQ